MHLAENELLRDIFQLGSRLLINDAPTFKQSKLERVRYLIYICNKILMDFSCFQHLLNAAAFKARTISRSKNRDKRSDF